MKRQLLGAASCCLLVEDVSEKASSVSNASCCRWSAALRSRLAFIALPAANSDVATCWFVDLWVLMATAYSSRCSKQRCSHLLVCRSVGADGDRLQLEMELHGMLTGVSAAL